MGDDFAQEKLRDKSSEARVKHNILRLVGGVILGATITVNVIAIAKGNFPSDNILAGDVFVGLAELALWPVERAAKSKVEQADENVKKASQTGQQG